MQYCVVRMLQDGSISNHPSLSQHQQHKRKFLLVQYKTLLAMVPHIELLSSYCFVLFIYNDLSSPLSAFSPYYAKVLNKFINALLAKIHLSLKHRLLQKDASIGWKCLSCLECKSTISVCLIIPSSLPSEPWPFKLFHLLSLLFSSLFAITPPSTIVFVLYTQNFHP